MDTLRDEKVEETVTVTAAEGVAAQPVPASSVTPVPMQRWYRRPIVIASVIAVVLLGGAGFYVYNTQYKNGGVVAVVNGTTIYADTYAENLRLVEESAASQGVDLSTGEAREQIRTQALNNLIENILLTDAAAAAGITVADADVEDIYSQLVEQTGGAEELAARMADIGLTEEKLRSNIRERVLVDKYIESVSDIETVTVTDEEVAAFIEAHVTDDAELPPMEEIRPVIESQILSMKRQEMVQGIIDSLRATAVITVHGT
jgi:peptidyl-prolyl cis-trans isomerase SurA